MIFLNFIFIFRLLGINNYNKNKNYCNNIFKLNNNNNQYHHNEIFNITNITNKNNDKIIPSFFVNISTEQAESISSSIISYGKYLNSSNGAWSLRKLQNPPEIIHFIFSPKESNNESLPKSNKSNESNESNISKIYMKNKVLQYAGFDMRYSNISLEIEIEENNLISKIRENFYKKNILDSLERNISINTKLEIIEKYNRLNINYVEYGINISVGNLYKDWNLDAEFEN